MGPFRDLSILRGLLLLCALRNGTTCCGGQSGSARFIISWRVKSRAIAFLGSCLPALPPLLRPSPLGPAGLLFTIHFDDTH